MICFKSTNFVNLFKLTSAGERLVQGIQGGLPDRNHRRGKVQRGGASHVYSVDNFWHKIDEKEEPDVDLCFPPRFISLSSRLESRPNMRTLSSNPLIETTQVAWSLNRNFSFLPFIISACIGRSKKWGPTMMKTLIMQVYGVTSKYPQEGLHLETSWTFSPFSAKDLREIRWQMFLSFSKRICCAKFLDRLGLVLAQKGESLDRGSSWFCCHHDKAAKLFFLNNH